MQPLARIHTHLYNTVTVMRTKTRAFVHTYVHAQMRIRKHTRSITHIESNMVIRIIPLKGVKISHSFIKHPYVREQRRAKERYCSITGHESAPTNTVNSFPLWLANTPDTRQSRAPSLRPPFTFAQALQRLTCIFPVEIERRDARFFSLKFTRPQSRLSASSAFGTRAFLFCG